MNARQLFAHESTDSKSTDARLTSGRFLSRRRETVIAHYRRKIAIDYTRATSQLACVDCGHRWFVWTAAWKYGEHSQCPTCYPNPKRRRLEDEEREYERVDVTAEVNAEMRGEG